ncbi:MAG: pro-sigmaK processing inhibitor BofA family protein [Deltaproteobacteria bacterium]
MGIETNTLLAYVFGLIVLYVIGKILIVPLKFLVKLFINAALGGIVLWLLNVFGGSVGINIGINVITAIVVGVLGIPGVILLVILNYFK